MATLGYLPFVSEIKTQLQSGLPVDVSFVEAGDSVTSLSADNFTAELSFISLAVSQLEIFTKDAQVVDTFNALVIVSGRRTNMDDLRTKAQGILQKFAPGDIITITEEPTVEDLGSGIWTANNFPSDAVQTGFMRAATGGNGNNFRGGLAGEVTIPFLANGSVNQETLVTAATNTVTSSASRLEITLTDGSTTFTQRATSVRDASGNGKVFTLEAADPAATGVLVSGGNVTATFNSIESNPGYISALVTERTIESVFTSKNKAYIPLTFNFESFQ